MTNEELEQENSDFRFRIFEKIEDKKPYETEKYRDYLYINHLGQTWFLDAYSEKGAEEIYKRGLVFKTEEEAEQYDKERILLFKLHKWAEEHNEGWTPNWKDFKEEKYTIVYDHDCEKFYVYLNFYYGDLSKLPLFKTEEIAEQFIEEFGEEIKEVLC